MKKSRLKKKYFSNFFILSFFVFLFFENDNANSLVNTQSNFHSNQFYASQTIVNTEKTEKNFLLKEIEKYNEKIKLYPNDASNYRLRGLAKQKLGDDEGAQRDFKKAYELTINQKYKKLFDAESYIQRALENEKYNPQKAFYDYDQALLLEPTNILALYLRASLKIQFKDFLGALKDYDDLVTYKNLSINKKLLNYIPSNIFYKRGNLKCEIGDFDGALDDYEKTESHNKMAMIFEKMKDYNNAALYYEKSININSRSKAANYFHMGRNLYLGGNFERSLNAFNTAISMNESCVTCREFQARIYEHRAKTKAQVGDKKGAVKDYFLALDLWYENWVGGKDKEWKKNKIISNYGNYVLPNVYSFPGCWS